MDNPPAGRRLSVPWPGSMPPAHDVEEVRRLGGRRSGARTADQTAAAIFWSGNPFIPWVEVARLLAERRPRGEAFAARAMSDVTAAIGRAVTFSRQRASMPGTPLPVEVIRGTAFPPNGNRHPDPGWEPLLGSSRVGEFPCEGCLAAGAAVAALRALLQSDAAMLRLTAPWESGLTREFDSLSQMLQESEDARVWAGLNFRSTAVVSTELGLRLDQEEGAPPPSPVGKPAAVNAQGHQGSSQKTP